MLTNCFSLPLNIKVSELHLYYETQERLPLSFNDIGFKSFEYVPVRSGGVTVSAIIEYEYKVDFPCLPFSFAWGNGIWCANLLQELPAIRADTPFRYKIVAFSVASIQDVVKLLAS